MDKTELFEKAPIHKAVINMAIPTILSMIVIILYNMADTFLWGRQGTLSTYPLFHWLRLYF